jgi:hypothetical protein
MKKLYLIICVICLTLIPTVIAAPIDFDNLHIASTGYGLAAYEINTRLMAAYNNEIYFILSDDGTANPSKVYCYNPSNGWSNSTNHSIVAETIGRFVTLRKINDLLYFSDTLGNVYSYNGSTLTAMSGTPFTANNYVSSIEEYNGYIYFGTSISSIYRYDGYTYEQVYEVNNHQPIVDMAAWQKDGYLYVSVGPENVCCPPTGYTIRSNSGNAGSWETVFQDVWHTSILMSTTDYLYTAVIDSAYWYGSSIRKSSNGTDFPVIHQSSGEYKVPWGSLYHNGIAYVFTNQWGEGYGYRIIDDNGTISFVQNQNWSLTQAIELNGQVYAIASSVPHNPLGEISPADVHLITTAMLTVVSPDGGEKWVAGTKQTIEWNNYDPNIDYVLIEYSTNNGQTWNDVDIWWNTGSYDWDPIPAIDSNQCLVRVSDLYQPNTNDTSDGAFTIFRCVNPIAGDLNGDCYVDFKDFAIIAEHWLNCGNPFDPACQP